MTVKEDKNKIESGLYIVSTPIGNLKDITLRAIDILKKSNLILCEDTRVSKKLLSFYEIKTKIISNHKFNEKSNLQKVLNILKDDQIVSVIDILPTIIDIIGGKVSDLDGKSFLPILNRKDKPIKEYVYGIATRQNIQKCYIFPSRSIRSKKFKYIKKRVLIYQRSKKVK